MSKLQIQVLPGVDAAQKPLSQIQEARHGGFLGKSSRADPSREFIQEAINRCGWRGNEIFANDLAEKLAKWK
jgi:hypothetical protein